MYILGMFGPGPNPSATLLKDGKIVAIVEEERLNRIKTSPNALPTKSAAECLKIAKITLDDVEGIGFAWDCERYSKEMPAFFERTFAQYEVDEHSRLHNDLLVNLYHPVRIREALQLSLGHLSKTRTLPPITFFPHHLCHAASTYYCSGYAESNILTIDGSGEEFTTMLGIGRGAEIEEVKNFMVPNSLGSYYATFTEFMGFIPYQDEGKLMGLASYGKYDESLQTKLDQLIPYDKETGDFTVDPVLRYFGKHTYGRRYTDAFVELFGVPRPKDVSALTAPYPDIAFAVQWRLEQIVSLLAQQLYKKSGIKKLCLAGGVAMNCVMNGKISELPFVDEVFVQPASSDNGVSLGAAQLLAKQKGANVLHKLDHAYWGPEYSDAHIEKALKEAKVSYTKSGNIAEDVAAYLEHGYIIGWVQGRMEVGARALGGRSILGNPLMKDMKDKLNLEVKHREDWRPFCPSMKAECYEKIMGKRQDSPFMILAFPVEDAYKESIPSVVHVDGTARPQTVRKEFNAPFWNLLDAFERRTGHGVLINTSFNVQGEPVICSPQDALRCYGGTGIDVLAMGSFLVKKPHVPDSLPA